MAEYKDLRKGDIVKCTGFYVDWYVDLIGVVTEIASTNGLHEPHHVYVKPIFEAVPMNYIMFYPREVEVLGHVES